MLNVYPALLLEYFQMTVFGRRIRTAGGRYKPAGIEILVVSLVLAGFMEVPVLVKIIAGAKGAQTQDGFGPFESPFGACHLHAIFNEMSACPLYDPCGDRKTLGKVTIIVKIG